MNKKIVENTVPLTTKAKTEPDFVVKIPTTGNQEPVVTQVYRVRTGGLLDANTNTVSISLETKFNKEQELAKKYEEVYRKTQKKFLEEVQQLKNNPFNFQNIGRAIRAGRGESLLGSKIGRGSFRLRSNRETADYVNTQIKKLMSAENVKRPAQLIERFKTSKLVQSEFTSQQTYIEAGMILKRLGISSQEILSLICERILQRKDLRQRYLSKNTPSLEGYAIPAKNEGQAGYELIYQWHLICVQNVANAKKNWKSRPPKYNKKKFYLSKTFNDWCIKVGVPKPSTYSNFVKFLNNLIKDYKKFCRQNRIQVLPYI